MKKLTLIPLLILSLSCQREGQKINRYNWVHRHMPSVTAPDSLSPFTVGNGEFAFTMDFTGLQSFPDFYDNGIPLGTQSHWGWHTIPGKEKYTLEQTYQYHNTYGRQVPYAGKQSSAAGQWLRSNPHRLHLGLIGLSVVQSDGRLMELSDAVNINQQADIWEGIVKSSFDVDGSNIKVETACHPTFDQLAVRITSKLLAKKSMSVNFDFPYGSQRWGNNPADWDHQDKHSSEISSQSDNSVTIKRTLDNDIYYTVIHWNGAAEFIETQKNAFKLTINDGEQFGFCCNFSKDKPDTSLPNVTESLLASQKYWQNFWETGGAVELYKSKDSRALELERRIVLSRYLMAVQCAGSAPPQETGLTFNSWYGKFHLEMHWWHGVHFPLWGQPELLEKSLGFYERILPVAQQKAKLQGYKGCRWPKMVYLDGKDSPSSVGEYLIWQQPHPIYYAELMYRTTHNPQILKRFKRIVFESADFMESYAHWDEATKRYVLGPPLIGAQETYKADLNFNPPFELAGWAFGLKTAQTWRERLGLPRNEKWDHIINHLSKPPSNNGFYQNTEIALNTFQDISHRRDHPSVLGAYGMLPNDDIDVDMMRATMEQVMKSWQWQHTWGWDYPLIAMCAARVGAPEFAIDALMLDVQKNTYLNNGHNYQDERLTIYLPGNGGLLTAIAMMAAGWDGCEDIHAPGFPKDGNWVVSYEGLNQYP